MTARTLDSADVIAAAGAELVAELERLLAEHAAPGAEEVPGLLDAITTLLRRARGRVRRAQPAEPASKPAPTTPARPWGLPPLGQDAAARQWAVLRHYQDAAQRTATQPAPARPRIVACAPVARAGAPAILPAPTPPNRGDLMPQPPRRYWLVIAGFAIAVLVGIAVVIAVMARGDDPGGQAAPGATSRQAPVYTPPAEKGDYKEPVELITAMNAKGIGCKLEPSDPPYSFNGNGARIRHCWIEEEGVYAVVYASSVQQVTDVADYKRNNWQVVEGNLWAVAVHAPETAVAVQSALTK